MELLSDHGNHLLETSSKDWICQVDLGFLNAMDSKAQGHGGAPQTLQLRQYEPNPVAAFPAISQLSKSYVVGAGFACVLGFQEAGDGQRTHYPRKLFF